MNGCQLLIAKEKPASGQQKAIHSYFFSSLNNAYRSKHLSKFCVQNCCSCGLLANERNLSLICVIIEERKLVCNMIFFFPM